MSKFSKGEQVVAVKDIGGFMRDHVPAGSPGVVIDGGWGVSACVLFSVKGGWFSADKKVKVKVEDHEVQ